MYALLAYGSLMHPAELVRHGPPNARTTAVRVHGFRRSLCQEPSWRPADSPDRAVLTVRPAEREWLNGVLIHGFGEGALAELDHRERGYVRATVSGAAIQPYDGELEMGSAEVVLYTGRDDKYNPALLPNAEYLDICLAAAASRGEEFYRDFLRSTFIADRDPLLVDLPVSPSGAGDVG